MITVTTDQSDSYPGPNNSMTRDFTVLQTWDVAYKDKGQLGLTGAVSVELLR